MVLWNDRALLENCLAQEVAAVDVGTGNRYKVAEPSGEL
jgi:hypothetical protein